MNNSVINAKKNMVKLYIGSYGYLLDRKKVRRIFDTLLTFKPTTISTEQYIKKRYKQELLDKVIDKTSTGYVYVSLLSGGGQSLTYRSDNMFRSVELRFELEYWENNKDLLVKQITELFIEIEGFFGYLANVFDDDVIQESPGTWEIKYDGALIGPFERYGCNDSDLKGILDIPVIMGDPISHSKYDKEYFPRHAFEYNYQRVAPSPYMWIGPDFLKFIPQKKLLAIQDCEENLDLGNGFRRIILLAEGLRYYNDDNLRAREWNFKRKLNLKRYFTTERYKMHMPALEQETFNADVSNLDFTICIIDGERCLRVKTFLNKNGKPLKKGNIPVSFVEKTINSKGEVISTTKGKI